MGIEYALRFQYPVAAAVIEVLESLPASQKPNSASSDLEMRFDLTSNGMPDASLRVESYGLYFCDNGGAGRHYLGEVVTRLVGEFGAVTITELE